MKVIGPLWQWQDKMITDVVTVIFLTINENLVWEEDFWKESVFSEVFYIFFNLKSNYKIDFKEVKGKCQNMKLKKGIYQRPLSTLWRIILFFR